jgi:hypothetical protein
MSCFAHAQKVNEAPIVFTDQSKTDPEILVMDPAQKNWSNTNSKAILWSWLPSESNMNPRGFGLPTEIYSAL